MLIQLDPIPINCPASSSILRHRRRRWPIFRRRATQVAPLLRLVDLVVCRVARTLIEFLSRLVYFGDRVP